jgi:hypothetical protein
MLLLLSVQWLKESVELPAGSKYGGSALYMCDNGAAASSEGGLVQSKNCTLPTRSHAGASLSTRAHTQLGKFRAISNFGRSKVEKVENKKDPRLQVFSLQLSHSRDTSLGWDGVRLSRLEQRHHLLNPP